MNKYTVVLLYPDYIAAQFGETYLAHVEAATVPDAVKAGQLEAQDGYLDLGEHTDFLPVFVVAGHHNDLGVL
jgi:hypothetical protein